MATTLSLAGLNRSFHLTNAQLKGYMELGVLYNQANRSF